MFVSFWSSSTLFPHKHTINNISFVHSHPYSSSDSSNNPFNHQHTANSIIVLQLISSIVCLIGLTVIVLKRIDFLCSEISFSRLIPFFNKNNYDFLFFRGPPSLV